MDHRGVYLFVAVFGVPAAIFSSVRLGKVISSGGIPRKNNKPPIKRGDEPLVFWPTVAVWLAGLAVVYGGIYVALERLLRPLFT